MKAFLFSILKKAFERFSGTGKLHRIPGVIPIKYFLFRLLLPNRGAVVEIQGSKMYVDPEGLPKGFRNTFQSYIVRAGWEALTTDMFKLVVKKGDVVLDLGANIGYFTLLAARLVGEEGKVISFEPEPNNYSVLVKNIELNGYKNVLPFRKAVADKSGTIKFFLHDSDTGAHTIFEPDNEKGFYKAIEVDVVALDEFLKTPEESHVDVVKMDVEGAEVAVLRGMLRILRQNPNIKMFIEFHPPGIKRRGDSSTDFAQYLVDNFSVLAIGDYSRNREYLKINSVDELMNFCKGGKTANLFVEKKG